MINVLLPGLIVAIVLVGSAILAYWVLVGYDRLFAEHLMVRSLSRFIVLLGLLLMFVAVVSVLDAISRSTIVVYL